MRGIEPGDFVVVVRPLKCGCASTMGLPFTVREIRFAGATCTECGKYETTLLARLSEDEWVDVAALKRIDPSAEQQRARQPEEQTA